MKRFFFWLIPVIILVSLNWFTKIYAGDLADLSDAEKARLAEQYLKLNSEPQGTPAKSDDDYYQSSIVLDAPRAIPKVESPKGFSGAEAASGSGRLLPFGYDLFSSPDGEIVPPDDIASSGDYVLGPGDNLIIYLWGRVEKEFNLTLDREGKIIIPRVGEITGWGQTLESFKETIRARLAKVYSEFDLTVSLGKIRSIRVYLTGEVRRPGAYTVSSLTSLFNALYLAGGPTSNGSMRRIRLMREGQVVTEVDLYRFLLEGDNSLDARLRSGDAIFVPVAGDRVAIQGQVRRAAVYELHGDEKISDLLELAGKATADAFLDRVMLERVAGRNEWEVLDLNLSHAEVDQSDNLPLMDGDRVTVFSIYDAKKNMVAIFGQVQHPGYYERNDSTSVSSLVNRSGLQPYDVLTERANLFRRHSDWRTEIIPIDLGLALAGDVNHYLTLNDKDSLHIYSVEDIDWTKTVHIDGEVQNPGEYPLYEGMTTRDLIFLAGSYTRSATMLRAELARVNSDGEVELLNLDLSSDRDELIELAEGDRVYIRQIPKWRRNHTVNLAGEVAYPGEYVLAREDETLYQLLQRAGGFTTHAFPKGLVLERLTIGSSLERRHIAQRLNNSTELTRDTIGNLLQEERFDLQGEMVNRIILDIDRIVSSQGREGDVILRPGDKLLVPTVPSGITVMGAVGATGTIIFRPGKKVNHYVDLAGGFTKRSDKKGTRLIRANGEVISNGDALGRRVELGDVIVVPSEIKDQKSNLTKNLAAVFTATTSILTTILLIDRL